MSTLSVETSNRGSSAWTWSPSCLSQRVIVPSVIDSPSSGIRTVTVSPPASAASAAAAGSSATSATAGSCPPASASAPAASAASAGVCAGASASAGAAAAWPSPAAEPLAPAGSISASSVPTATVSSSWTGEGTSVSTLSVETSNRGSSAWTWSPSCLSQRVIVPSVIDSPSSGILIGSAIALVAPFACRRFVPRRVTAQP